jgi:hypothetical protein
MNPIYIYPLVIHPLVIHPLVIYPLVLLVIFIYINSRIILPEMLTKIVFLLVALYYTLISPVYGVVAAGLLLIVLHRISNKNEGFATGSGETIPPVIWQTWHTKNLPNKMADCVKRLKSANPGFEHHLYDDKECRLFIKENFDASVVEAYDRLIPGAFKADLWRYCVLYKRGGFYVDIKFQCEPGFSFSQINDPFFYVGEYSYDGSGKLYDHIVYTGVIGSRANNPLFDKCIRQIVENVNRNYYGPEHTSPTGPWLFASKMDPEDMENIEYSYYEIEGVGHIRHIEQHNVILSHYPEYRAEQRSNSASSYWKDAWARREVYAPPRLEPS